MASTVLWIDARSDDSFLRDHEYISRRVQRPLRPKATPRTQLEDFYHQLSLESGTSIVIWDNVDIASELVESVSSSPSATNICIIITSRNATFSRRFAKDTTGYIHLRSLSTSESVVLLGKTAGLDASDATLLEVVSLLDGLPLALCQAGSYMRRHNVSPLEYISLYDQTSETFKGYNASIYRTIGISLDELVRNEAPALKVLSLLSIFDTSRIPKYLLLSKATKFTPPLSIKGLEHAIHSLESYSLVHLTPDGDHLDMHRLVQGVIRRRLNRKGDVSAWENTALRVLSSEFPTGIFENWSKCGELLPHALVVLEYGIVKDVENFIPYYELLRNAGVYVLKTGRYVDAEKLLREAYFISLKRGGQDSKNTYSIATLLAQLCLLMGKLNEAEILENQVIEWRVRELGAEHPDTLTSMANLVSTYRNQGRWKEAEELGVEVVEKTRRVLGADHQGTLTSIANLASIYRDQGRWKQAEELRVEVVEKTRRVLGPDHPDTLASMANLVSTYGDQERWKEAEELGVEVVEKTRMILGAEHPGTLTSMANLASTYGGQGRWKEAEELEIQVIQIRERVIGKEHPETLTSMANLALTYGDQGRWKEAEELEIQVIELRKRVLGEEHPSTLTSIANLASIRNAQGG